MAPMWPYYRLWPVLWQWNKSTTSQISAATISSSWLLISSKQSITYWKTYTSPKRLCLVSEWTMRRLMPAKKCMLFWNEHKDDIEYIQCGRFRYVKVINEDRASVTTTVVVKQLCYIPITPRPKQLFLSEETVKQMRWHKEGKCDSKDINIMSHPVDSEAWQALDCFDPKFACDHRSIRLGFSTDSFQPYNTNYTPYSC
jgi:hypothetical protein